TARQGLLVSPCPPTASFSDDTPPPSSPSLNALRGHCRPAHSPADCAMSPMYFAHRRFAARRKITAMDATKAFFRDKVVLITGASSGIGKELAWQLGQMEAKLTLAARRKELLEGVAQRIAAAGKPLPSVVACDVTRDDDMERSVVQTVREFGKLDVVIANAGFGVIGPLKKLSIADYRRQFETNV